MFTARKRSVNTDIPEFGERVAGVAYQARPGAYAIIFNDHRQVAVVKTPEGLFLPGGGLEMGESPETALAREVREECGWDVLIRGQVGRAVQYVHAPGEGYFAKQCIFYLCAIRRRSRRKTESDHETLWFDVTEALGRLKHQSQSAAISRASALNP